MSGGAGTSTPPVRIAILGCGFQGTFHAQTITASPDAELVASCDFSTEAAQRIADAHGGAVHTDPSTVLADEDVDAVIIATPSDTHAELAIAAAAAGKHILQEKPMATTVADCLAIEEAVDAAGVIMTLGFKFRWAPAVLAAKAAVPEPVALSGHTMYDASQPISGWVNDPRRSGGRILSSLVHTVDLLRFLTGSEPVRASAESAALAVPGLQEPDTLMANLVFANGAMASIVHGSVGQSGLLSVWSFQTAAPGINATIHSHCRQVVIHDAASGEPDTEVIDDVADPFLTGMSGLLAEFVDAVRTGREATPNPRDGTLALTISQQILHAAATRSIHDISPPDPVSRQLRSQTSNHHQE